ncbi:MAG: SDR family NAD(P)-dependent oxidoreductase, partial [Candidatus Obscuribacterales bacterium]|nr:SDR family NAD(P)-dependent oxidoreductase [Candidatus Obscuribacterales bacterium]
MTTNAVAEKEVEAYKLTDKVAIITGSGRGIGRAIAEKLLSAGAKVVISDINEETCQKTANELKEQGGQTLAIVCDVTNSDSVEKMIEQVVKQWGAIDILVNNAGITRDNLY